MIKLTEKTEQDFLSIEWCKKLTEAGVDMSDAKYGITCISGVRYVVQVNSECKVIPTYTLPELLYKLNEYPAGTERGLRFVKDAPYYCFSYKYSNGSLIEGVSEYPIEAAASLLLQSTKVGIPCNWNISDK